MQLPPAHIWKLFSAGGAPQGRVPGERRRQRGDGQTRPSVCGVQDPVRVPGWRRMALRGRRDVGAGTEETPFPSELRTRAHRGPHVGPRSHGPDGTLGPTPRLPAHLEPRRRRHVPPRGSVFFLTYLQTNTGQSVSPDGTGVAVVSMEGGRAHSQNGRHEPSLCRARRLPVTPLRNDLRIHSPGLQGHGPPAVTELGRWFWACARAPWQVRSDANLP